MKILILIVIGIFIEIIFSPRLDWTSENELLLWYGGLKRRFIKLWSNEGKSSL